MKFLFGLLAQTVLLVLIMESCSPTITPVPPTTMLHTKSFDPRTSAILKIAGDSNVYDYDLSCGCSFPLKAEGADTSHIYYYDLTHLKDTITHHVIIAKARLPLVTGTYTGWLAVTTIQPITTELLKDTLRDTLIVP